MHIICCAERRCVDVCYGTVYGIYGTGTMHDMADGWMRPVTDPQGAGDV